MVNFPGGSRFSFASGTSSASSPSSTPSSSMISSRSRMMMGRQPSSPPPKSPATTALSILSDFSNCSEPFPLTRKPAKRPKTSDGQHHQFTSFSDLLSIPPSVLDREMAESEREREQRERDRQEGKPTANEASWTAPPTPDLYFLPSRASTRFVNHHQRSLSDPSPTVSTFEEATTALSSSSSSSSSRSSPPPPPTRPGFVRTQTDPGRRSDHFSTTLSTTGGGSRRSSTGSPTHHRVGPGLANETRKGE